VQLREKWPEFEALGVRVVCVVQGTAEEAERICGRNGLTQGCIGDPAKESYRAIGFGRTGWKEILFASDELKERRAEASRLGCGVSLKGTLQKHSDVLQLPGAALVERGGRILWLNRPQTLAGLPRADELLRVVTEKLGK
jgi:hypothetical protein